MKGGHLLGKGSYGCGFTTASPCVDPSKNNLLKKKTKHSERIVSKRFFSRSNFLEEQQLINIVKKIDPKHVFTVPIHMVCTTTENIDRDKDLCKKNDTNDIGVQIVMGYGGEKIDSRYLPISNDVMGGMWTGLPKILSGFAKMHHHGYIHCDLKYDNILFDTNKQKYNLIDFGLASKTSDISLLDSKHKASNYYWYPMEFYLVNTLHYYVLQYPLKKTIDFLKTISHEDTIMLFEKDFARSAFIFPFYVQHFQDVHLVEISQFILKEYIAILEVKAIQNIISSNIIEEASKLLLSKLSSGYDLFGFGVVMLQYLDHTKVFFKSLSTEAKMHFGRILRLSLDLCHPDIRKRVKCNKAIKHVKIIQNINTKDIIKSISYILKPYYVTIDSMYNDKDISDILNKNNIQITKDVQKNRKIFLNEFSYTAEVRGIQ